MKQRYVSIVFALLAAGCQPSLGPKAAGWCLASPRAHEQADDIRKAVIEGAGAAGLVTADFTDQFRRLEGNRTLVFLRFKEDRFFSRFNVELKINPTFGGSTLTVYGQDARIPDALAPVVTMLEGKFDFSLTGQGDHGQCPKDPASQVDDQAKSTSRSVM